MSKRAILLIILVSFAGAVMPYIAQRHPQDHIDRRQKLVKKIKQTYPDVTTGVVLIIGGLESDCTPFRQESSCYYLTGITEPGVVMMMDLDGAADLFVPDHGAERQKWVTLGEGLAGDSLREYGFDNCHVQGAPCAGYQFCHFFAQKEYQAVLDRLKQVCQAGGKIFTLKPNRPSGYIEQRYILERIQRFLPSCADALVDISDLVAQLRRTKNQRELSYIQQAIEITCMAHEAAARMIKPDVFEYGVQAGIEFVFTDGGAMRPAFPSIVGSGPNSTVLHYVMNNRVMQAGDLVVVDIGAEFNFYPADLTRTYPVSGTFTDRQREVYQAVLDTQTYIAELAKPGMWLRNKNKPEQSLHHLAAAYLDDLGFGQYFPHGIGHFVGLDVHDVGDYSVPLQEGDVFTIEPGIYIPQEELGVRIEDNYLVVKDGVVCLSDQLPREPHEIEAMMRRDVSEFEHEA